MNQVISSRIFEVPRELLYRAWTEPEYLARWWGPKGFSNSFHIYDLKPQGRWSFIMHGPDGKDYPNEVVFVEVKAPERLVWDHLSAPLFRIRASFEERSETQSEVIFRMLFEEERVYNSLKDFCREKNEENFDRLEVVLEAMKQR